MKYDSIKNLYWTIKKLTTEITHSFTRASNAFVCLTSSAVFIATCLSSALHVTRGIATAYKIIQSTIIFNFYDNNFLKSYN